MADGWVAVPFADTWTYASASTITVPSGAAAKYSPGMRVKLTQTTVKYFIITAVADTLLTVYGGTDYTVANAAIAGTSYSSVKAPLGFPLDPALWTVIVEDTQRLDKTNCTAGTWYGGANAWTSGTNVTITVPIGVWKLSFSCVVYGVKGNASFPDLYICLSTTNNAPSNPRLEDLYLPIFAPENWWGNSYKEDCVTCTAATPYYFMGESGTTGTTKQIDICGDLLQTTLRAECKYL